MVLDTSAIVAILRNEPEAPRLEVAIERDPLRLISAATLVECGMVVEARYGEPGGRELDLLLHRAGAEVIAVDSEQAEIARTTYRRWGKGRDGRAGLNFGDCFPYALSRASGEPLLFKGSDFTRTDVTVVAY